MEATRSSLHVAVSRLALVQFDTARASDAFDLVTRVAVEVTPGATAATLRFPKGVPDTDRRPTVVGTDGRFVELECGRSPAVDALSSGEPVYGRGDLSKWPVFAGLAVRLGVCDVIASPLSLPSNQPACLSVYSEDSRFDQQAGMAVEVLTRHASVTVANAFAFSHFRVVNDQLNEGLRSREVIGLAKGILMRQERCSEADAFRILVSSSQRLNLKVREVARHVVALAEGRSDLPQERHD